MLTQRNGVTTHKVLHQSTRFGDFHELVTFENLGKVNHTDKAKGTVYVPHNDTTYTLLAVLNASAC